MQAEKHNDFNMLKWCPETELNRRHADFQSAALPTELSGHRDRSGHSLWLGRVIRYAQGAVQRVFVPRRPADRPISLAARGHHRRGAGRGFPLCPSRPWGPHRTRSASAQGRRRRSGANKRGGTSDRRGARRSGSSSWRPEPWRMQSRHHAKSSARGKRSRLRVIS